MPRRIDCSFDSTWEALDMSCKHLHGISIGENSELSFYDNLRQFSIPLIWTQQYNNNQRIALAIDESLSALPLQSCKFLAKRILHSFDPAATNERQRGRVAKRILLYPRNTQMVRHFLDALAKKFGHGTVPAVGVRKAGIVARKMMAGSEIELFGTKFVFSTEVRLSFLLNGFLYIYRNERLHGTKPSPFISSKATIKTFTLAHSAFLMTHLLLLLILNKWDPGNHDSSDICFNQCQNLEGSRRLYGRHVDR